MSVEEPYVFVDTNVLVYAHDVSAGEKHERAAQLIAELWENRTGCLSVQVLEEFYVTVTRKVARPLDVETAVEIVEELTHWRVHAPRPADVIEAIRIHRQLSISLWDALIIQSAARLGCGALWSEDLNVGQLYVGVRVQNPFVSLRTNEAD
jgi:predicted nucleic acid-binding protein